MRLRKLLEENLRISNCLKGNNENYEGMKGDLEEKNLIIEQMVSDNTALAKACQDKDDENKKLQENISNLKSKSDKQKKLLNSQKKTK